MSRHIVIDLETLDTRPSAIIATCGAVLIEARDGQADILACWYHPLELQQPDRTCDADTARWWNEQTEAARLHCLNGVRQPFETAMRDLHTWLNNYPYPIWGNGSDFDNAILRDAFDQLGLTWPYRRNRCLRSLRGALLDLGHVIPMPEWPADRIRHHALHDAEHEARQLAALLHAIQPKEAPCSNSAPKATA